MSDIYCHFILFSLWFRLVSLHNWDTIPSDHYFPNTPYYRLGRCPMGVILSQRVGGLHCVRKFQQGAN